MTTCQPVHGAQYFLDRATEQKYATDVSPNCLSENHLRFPAMSPNGRRREFKDHLTVDSTKVTNAMVLPSVPAVVADL